MKTANRDNTTKKNIINNIFNTLGVPVVFATKLVDELISIIIFTAHTKKKLTIKNFGTFSLKEKTKRIGRNPKNKISHEILERNVLTFKAAVELSKKVNVNVKK